MIITKFRVANSAIFMAVANIQNAKDNIGIYVDGLREEQKQTDITYSAESNEGHCSFNHCRQLYD